MRIYFIMLHDKHTQARWLTLPPKLQLKSVIRLHPSHVSLSINCSVHCDIPALHVYICDSPPVLVCPAELVLYNPHKVRK